MCGSTFWAGFRAAPAARFRPGAKPPPPSVSGGKRVAAGHAGLKFEHRENYRSKQLAPAESGVARAHAMGAAAAQLRKAKENNDVRHPAAQTEGMRDSARCFSTAVVVIFLHAAGTKPAKFWRLTSSSA